RRNIVLGINSAHSLFHTLHVVTVIGGTRAHPALVIAVKPLLIGRRDLRRPTVPAVVVVAIMVAAPVIPAIAIAVVVVTSPAPLRCDFTEWHIAWDVLVVHDLVHPFRHTVHLVAVVAGPILQPALLVTVEFR